MTENKRFTITQDFEEHHRQIRDNGHIIMGCFVEQQAEIIVNLLNEQHEQIERLKGNFRALDEVKCELAEENEQLKQQKDKWKQQCIHFKEMLDDMDITYLCDEWIYEELKGDVE